MENNLAAALDNITLNKEAASSSEVTQQEYKFWGTQPVPKLDEEIKDYNGPIEPEKKIEDVPDHPQPLVGGFTWCTLDIDNDETLTELYNLLNMNYVEDEDHMFRFDYSPEFLRWALKPPGWIQDWHCGVRTEATKKLVAFISAIPATILVHKLELKTVEINFLCVHKKLRTKRMAPVLIKEITRRVNKHGIFQAVYTAGRLLPSPVGTCRYWHRSLNPKKLVEVQFSHLTQRLTMARAAKLYKLPNKTKGQNFRPLKEDDIPQLSSMLKNYLVKFKLCPLFSLEEIAHWFLPRKNIVSSYVIDDPVKGIIGFCSYYTLPSTVMNHPVHKNIKAAYSFYNIPTEHVTLKDLMNDALITAKNVSTDLNILSF